MARELFELAELGTLQGLTFVAKIGRRQHQVGVVGDYTDRPEEALLATLKMKQRLLAVDTQY